MKRLDIVFERYVDLGDTLIFPAFDHNSLYSMNKATKEVALLGEIPCERRCSIRSFFSVECYKNLVILIPFDNNNIVIYNIEQKTFSEIELKTAFELGGNIDFGKFACSAIYNNKLYVFPHYYPALVILNLDDYSLIYDVEFVNELKKKKVFSEPYITDVDVLEKVVYGSVGCFNGIIIYDMEVDSFYVKTLAYSGNGFNGIKIDEKNIIIAPRITGPVLRCDINLNTIKELREGYEWKQAVPCHSILKWKNSFIFVPAMATELVVLNEGKMSIVKEVSDALEGKIYTANNFDRVLAYGLDGDVLWFISGLNRQMYEYDLESGRLKYRKLYCENSIVTFKEVFDLLTSQGPMIETINWKLKEYLDIV